MENTDPAKKTLDALRATILKDERWHQNPNDSSRIESAKDEDGKPYTYLAIETGYEHGQVTFRVSENRLRRNSRWLLVLRGHNQDFIDNSLTGLEQLMEMEKESNR